MWRNSPITLGSSSAKTIVPGPATAADQPALSLKEKLNAEAKQSSTWVKISDDWDGIAAWLGADPKTLKATVEESFCLTFRIVDTYIYHRQCADRALGSLRKTDFPAEDELQSIRGKRVAVVGAGPGGLSTALAFHQAGYHVRVFERAPKVQPLGGAVLLSLPVMSILRSYGVDISRLGSYAEVQFRNSRGKVRAILPFNKQAEECAKLPGWHYGMLRSDAFSRMLAAIPEDIIEPGRKLERFEDGSQSVRLFFENGETYEADLLVGADGIRSTVARQLFGDPHLFHCGIQVWLAWCYCEGIPRGVSFISHSPTIQASFFPMLHHGREAFEWWVVEPWDEGVQFNGSIRDHLMARIVGWCDPLPRLAAATDFERNCFRWEIYNRPSLQKWSRGRVVCLGDAVHPVSPYAAYGMGMAIEDGFFLAKFLAGKDLTDLRALAEGFALFEKQRVAYANHHTEFARKLGKVFHRLPWPLCAVRDLVFDNTKFLEKMIVIDYLKRAEEEMLALEL